MSGSRPAGAMFAALAVPNYRRYFIGQAVSLSGTWMQAAALAWLVLTMTRSATDLGVTVALQTLPTLLLGPYGGVVADRVDKRRLMIGLQSIMGVQALVLGLLVVSGAIRFSEICVLSLVLGLNNCFENPLRQTFVLEMVDATNLRNAVGLNSSLNNSARAVGPALAGLLIAGVGTGWCFLLNAASFVAVVWSLLTMDRAALVRSPPAGRGPRQLRDGLAYVARSPEIAVPLLMVAVVGTLAYEFQVTLPVLASQVFHGGAQLYGFMTASMGIGAAAGGLATAARGRTGLGPLVVASAAFGAMMLLAATAPNLPVEFVALFLVGFGSVAFLTTSNATLQLAADPLMRGRVMGLWAVAFLGSTPVGGPLIGWITSSAGARAGLGVGALSSVVVAVLGAAALSRRGRSGVPDPIVRGGARDAGR